MPVQNTRNIPAVINAVLCLFSLFIRPCSASYSCTFVLSITNKSYQKLTNSSMRLQLAAKNIPRQNPISCSFFSE